MKLLKGMLIFLMLWEWLKLLPLIAHFTNVSIFVFALAVFSLIEIIVFEQLYKFILKTLLFAGTVFVYFRKQLELAPSWWQFVKAESFYSLEKVYQGNWVEITAFSRTVLFMCTLWLSAGIVFRAVRNGQGVWFSLTSLAYLILLDITTDLDIKWAIVRVSVCALFLLSLLQIERVQTTGTTYRPVKFNPFYWIASSLVVIVIMNMIAYAIPKPQQAASQQVFDFFSQGLSTYNKIGYDSQDHKLGGPFEEDNTIVFHAVTSSKQYWRGESRNVYTGSEWQSATEEQTTLPLGPTVGLQIPSTAAKKVENTALVTFAQPKYDVLFYDGYLKKISALDPKPLTLFTTGNQDIKAKYDSNKQHINAYQITEDIPVINESELKNSPTNYPDEITKEYLQLPSTLPSRVVNLAKQITETGTNSYDKALMIQNYLKSEGGFAYERSSVPYVLPGQDFVDQFLFESKRGYCEHFSSSMVILLRSIGIPARYVKGFSAGEITSISENKMEVTMRNKDAHSWVEVYFNQYGWVTFEPTPGFTNPEKKEAQEQKVENKVDQSKLSTSSSSTPTPVNKPADTEVSGSTYSINTFQWKPWAWGVFVVVIILLSWKRKQVRFWILHARAQRAVESDHLYSIYLSLLSLFGEFYTRRKSNETIREYVERLAINTDSKEQLWQLTRYYESYTYGKHKDNNTDEIRKKLQKIIRYFIS